MIRLFWFALLTVLLLGCASGSAVVTGTKRPPIAVSDVQLFVKPPAQYEVIGVVRASSESGLTQQGSTDYAVEELKKQAAALGANGLLFTSIGGRNDTANIVGEAIFFTKR